MVEYTLLDVLSRQVGVHHLRMQQVARATALSSSATTRLVARLEARGLLTRFICVDDRRGIYTELTEAGAALLDQARPVHDATLRAALTEAESTPELQPLLAILDHITAETVSHNGSIRRSRERALLGHIAKGSVEPRPIAVANQG